MKNFRFEIEITEEDVNGDEFFEDAIKIDGTGISTLKNTIIEIIESSNLFINSDREVKDIVKLIEYKDE